MSAPVQERSPADPGGGASAGSGRALSIIPIVHTAADLGSLGPAHAAALAARVGRAGAHEHAQRVDAFWDSVHDWARRLQIPPGGLFIYQDGLPILPDGMPGPQTLVDELARAGSRNHAVLRELAARGATIVGTEPPELLTRELALAREIAAGPDPRHAHRARALLELRDRAIGRRIDSTLPAGCRGVLFIGRAHAVEPHLPPGLTIDRPLAAGFTHTGTTQANAR